MDSSSIRDLLRSKLDGLVDCVLKKDNDKVTDILLWFYKAGRIRGLCEALEAIDKASDGPACDDYDAWSRVDEAIKALIKKAENQ